MKDHADQTKLLTFPADESKSANSENPGEAPNLEHLKATLPSGGQSPDGKSNSGDGSKPAGVVERAIESVKKTFRRGAPCKSGNCGQCKNCVEGKTVPKPGNPIGANGKPFGTPVSAPTATAQSPAASDAVPVKTIPPALLSDYEAYGEAGAALICGIYEIRSEIFCDSHRKQLPPQAQPIVDRVHRSLCVPESIANSLRRGYSGLAMAVGAPVGGGHVALLVSAHINLELHFRKGVKEMKSELAALIQELRAHSSPAPGPSQPAPAPNGTAPKTEEKSVTLPPRRPPNL